MIKTVTSREFNHDVSKIKRDSQNGPVFITDRGKPRHVLLSIEYYEKLAGHKETIIDLLAMPQVADIDFEVKPIKGDLFNADKDLD